MMHRILHNWWQKLVAVLLASIIWLVVSTNQTQITQRSLLVPLVIEGLSSTQIVSSVPQRVEVTVSGLESRVDGLTPENFKALLNLSNVQGEFEREISLNLLQGIDLIRLNPRRVRGFVETEEQKAIDVRIALFDIAGIDYSYQAIAAPQRVLVRGRAEDLTKVSHAMALVAAQSGQREVHLFAADEAGDPLNNVSLDPAETTVEVIQHSVIHERVIPLIIEPPNVEPLVIESFEPSHTELRVVGPLAVLNDISELTATVDTNDLSSEAGQYTLAIVPVLPDQVRVLEQVSVSTTLVANETNDVEEEP